MYMYECIGVINDNKAVKHTSNSKTSMTLDEPYDRIDQMKFDEY